MQPNLERTSWFGFSFGGIITANLANRHAGLSLPTPQAIFGLHVTSRQPAGVIGYRPGPTMASSDRSISRASSSNR